MPPVMVNVSGVEADDADDRDGRDDIPSALGRCWPCDDEHGKPNRYHDKRDHDREAATVNESHSPPVRRMSDSFPPIASVIPAASTPGRSRLLNTLS